MSQDFRIHIKLTRKEIFRTKMTSGYEKLKIGSNSDKKFFLLSKDVVAQRSAGRSLLSTKYVYGRGCCVFDKQRIQQIHGLFSASTCQKNCDRDASCVAYEWWFFKSICVCFCIWSKNCFCWLFDLVKSLVC